MWCLESQITELIAVVKLNAVLNNQSLPSDRALRTQAIEKLIIDNLQTQMAERMGIQISDPQLEQTILNIAQGENMKIAQFREKVAQEGVSYDTYREEIRKELILGEVRRANVRRRVYITEQEINNLVTLIDEQGDEQAEYNLGHILIEFPPEPTDTDIEQAKNRANKVIELLNKGSDFAKNCHGFFRWLSGVRRRRHGLDEYQLHAHLICRSGAKKIQRRLNRSD